MKITINIDLLNSDTIKSIIENYKYVRDCKMISNEEMNKVVKPCQDVIK